MSNLVSHNFCISKGSDFVATMELLNDDDTIMNLAGKSAKLIVRERNSESSNLILEEDCTINNNIITLSFSHQITNDITQSKGYYNVFLLEEPTQKVKILEGEIEFKESLM